MSAVQFTPGSLKITGPRGTREVKDALLAKHTAVHRSVGRDTGLFIVTHRPTGCALAYVDDGQDAAVEVARMLETEHATDLERLAGLDFGKQPSAKKYAPVRKRLIKALEPWR